MRAQLLVVPEADGDTSQPEAPSPPFSPLPQLLEAALLLAAAALAVLVLRRRGVHVSQLAAVLRHTAAGA